MNRFQLHCHPATPCPARLDISALVRPVETQEAVVVRFEFVATGEVHRVRIPPPVAHPTPTDGLWQHTCFEAFVASPTDTTYSEFNFSPSGEWAHYTFTSERQRKGIGHAEGLPGIKATSSPNALTLAASAAFSPTQFAALVGLCAVFELEDGSLSYWALHHPRGKPDFHNRQGWVLTL